MSTIDSASLKARFSPPLLIWGRQTGGFFDAGTNSAGDPIGKLWYSNELGGLPAVKFDIDVTLDNFYEYIEFEGETYYPTRLVTYKFGPPDSGVMHVYAEYKKG